MFLGLYSAVIQITNSLGDRIFAQGLASTATAGKEEDPDTGELIVPRMGEGDTDTGKGAVFNATGFRLNILSHTDREEGATGANRLGVVGTARPG